jgi:hypothetical protein
MDSKEGYVLLMEYKEHSVKGQCYELAAYLRDIERRFLLSDNPFGDYEGFNKEKFISALCECNRYSGGVYITRDLKIKNLLSEL